MKRELEKITGSMLEETARVQQRLHEAIQQPRNKHHRMHWQYPLIAVLFLAFASVFIFSELTPSEQEVRKVAAEPISDELFNWYVVSQLYEDGRFLHITDAVEYSAYQYLRNNAFITYARAQGITLEQGEINERIVQFEESWAMNDWQQQQRARLFELVNATEETKKAYLTHAARQQLSREKLEEKFVQYNDKEALGTLETTAWTYYEEVAAAEIALFYKQYQLKESTASTIQILETPIQYAFADALDFAQNEEGHYIFADGEKAQRYIESNYGDVLYEASVLERYPFTFGPLYFKEYKVNVEQLAANEGPSQQKAKELVLLLELLAETYKDTYAF